ncbi:hypothetical protein [Providencia stuartii]|uniref:hypothetical protein n=1 Tax=Providencia stuartii TaxID=588 RepID=UPI00249DCF44
MQSASDVQCSRLLKTTSGVPHSLVAARPGALSSRLGFVRQSHHPTDHVAWAGLGQ